MSCPNGTSKVIQSDRSTRLSIRLGLVSGRQIRKIRCSDEQLIIIEETEHEDEEQWKSREKYGLIMSR